MNPYPFKTRGFDMLIGPGQGLTGTLTLAPGTTTQFDGSMFGNTILSTDQQSNAKTTIVIGSTATIMLEGDLSLPNITIIGKVDCAIIRCTGVLAIRKGAIVTAKIIQYSKLIIEDGAILTGMMEPLKVENAS